MAHILARPDYRRPSLRITDEKAYYSRREILKQWGIAAAGVYGLMASGCSAAGDPARLYPDALPVVRPPKLPPADPTDAALTALRANPLAYVEEGLEGLFPTARNEAFKVAERGLTPELIAATNGNYYEFLITSGSPKDAWEKTRDFNQRPWEVEIGGLVDKPGTYHLDDLARMAALEERVYRFRCVEAWAMTVPWSGFSFSKLCEKVGVKNEATHVRFVTYLRPAEAVGQDQWYWYEWPYYEGLRMDEAMNELTLLAFGIYGHPLPMQHGAPLRIVTPWKYGYKSIKSIVKIEFVDSQPRTFWSDSQPNEYPFLSNVDPAVPHPRWSQASERLIDTGDRVKTLPYNGYGDYVAKLYA